MALLIDLLLPSTSERAMCFGEKCGKLVKKPVNYGCEATDSSSQIDTKAISFPSCADGNLPPVSILLCMQKKLFFMNQIQFG